MSSSEIKSHLSYDKVKSKVLLQCFILALSISLCPFKLLSYGIPVFLLIFVLIRFYSKYLYRNLFISIVAIALVLIIYIIKDHYLGYNFNLLGGFLSIITYGSIIFVLIYPNFTSSFNSTETNLLNKVIYIIFVIETIVVLFQLVFYLLLNSASFDDATGDIIQGTINIFSFINKDVGFNNQIFTVNYIFLLLYGAPYFIKIRKKFLIFGGVLIILFASVLHVVFSFILALVTVFLLIGFIKFRKYILRGIFVCAFLLSVLYITQPKNFSLINFYYSSIVSLQSPKVLIVANTIANLPHDYPDALFLGLGPGQYTSRASLMTSGHYFGDFNKPTMFPLLDGSFTSKPFMDYVFDIWESYATNVEMYGNSTMSRPFFSIFSFVIEFGFVFLLAILIVLIRYLKRSRRRYLQLSKNREVSYYIIANILSILFIFYLGFFENYLESSASICSGLILVKYFNKIKS